MPPIKTEQENPPLPIQKPALLNLPEVLQLRLGIESTFSAEIKAARFSIVQPDFATPSDIKELNFGVTSEEPRDWAFIKNKYESAKKLGRLVPKSDDLREIINRCKKLVANPALQKSSSLFAYLGYFNYINESKQEAVHYLQIAAKISEDPQDWYNLASLAFEMEEKELTCLALGRIFIKAPITDPRYEGPWFAFAELVHKFSYYSILKLILGNTARMLLKDEYNKLFETVCFWLIKRGEIDQTDLLIEKYLATDNYYTLIFDALDILPKDVTPGFAQFKSNFERLTINSLPSNIPTKPSYSIKKPKINVLVTKESDLHREAWRASVQKDYENAETLFRKAIGKNINKPAAVRDLAMMLDHLKRTNEALELMEEHTDGSDQDKNILYNLYYKLQKYEKAAKVKIELYNNYIKSENTGKKATDSITSIRNKKITMLSEIARAYFGMKQFEKAIESYRKALTFSPNDVSIRRNIAICHYKNDDAEAAKAELKKLVEQGDKKSIELLQAIETPSGTPNIQNINVIIANLISQRSTDLDQFTQFYLDKCTYRGVPPDRLEAGKYATTSDQKGLEMDIDRLEKAAQALGTARPGERSEFFLSASKIIFDSQSNNPNFFRYLCKSFTSKADAAVYEGKALDSVKTLYLQALKIYDSYTEQKDKEFQFDEQDAVNAMYRYIYAQLGTGEIPVEPKYIGKVDALDKQIKLIKESCESSFSKIYSTYGNYGIILDAIRLLVLRSPKYGSTRLLQIVYENPAWIKISVEYLRNKAKNNDLSNTPSLEEFVKSWQEAADTILDYETEVAFQLGFLRQFLLSDAWLRDAGQRIEQLFNKEFSFSLDRDYLKRLRDILDDSSSYVNASGYDDKISRYSDIESKCNKLLDDIEKNPTKLSIEDIFIVVDNIRRILTEDNNRFLGENKPSLTFSSALKIYLLKENQSVDVQITIKNKGAGHAEQIELSIQEDNNYYTLPERNSIAYGTIRGGEEGTIIVNVLPADLAKTEKAFSLILECFYKTRKGEPFTDLSDPITIQLGSEEDFIQINPNPYAIWASADAVHDPKMFYGREKFLEEAHEIICDNYKSFAISGQKRAGKSSILYHLGLKLRGNKNLLVADVGNIGSMIDENAKIPFTHQFFYGILSAIRTSLQESESFSELSELIPDGNTFYNDKTPIVFFKEKVTAIKKKLQETTKNPNFRIIVLIDEFTYIYTLMVSEEYNKERRLGPEFLRNWKAMLEAKIFSVVFVAQDFFDKLVNVDKNSFAMVENKRVSYLEKPSAEMLIDEPIRIKGNPPKSRFTEKAIERLFQLTAGSPYYIQIFCNHLVNYVNKEKAITITDANVDYVLKNNLCNYLAPHVGL